MLDFKLLSPSEVCLEIGMRLKAGRLASGIQQAELAARAGIARNTLMAMESNGQGSMTTLVRVAAALGLVDQMQSLFVVQVRSIAQLEAQSAPLPQRIRKPGKKGQA